MKTKLTILLSLVFMLILNLGCNLQQKREDRAYRFFREHPAKLAELCANEYPPKDSISPGKEILITDTLKVPGDSIPCPPVPGQKPVFVKCPEQKTITNTRTKTDTIFRENTARVASLNAKLQEANTKLAICDNQFQEETKEKQKFKAFALVEGVLLLICAFLIFKPKFL